MKKAILGKKLGMTQIFDNNGLVVPVTAIEAGPCFVSQVKTEKNDGYTAVQIAFDNTREQLINKPMLGQLKKSLVMYLQRVILLTLLVLLRVTDSAVLSQNGISTDTE